MVPILGSRRLWAFLALAPFVFLFPVYKISSILFSEKHPELIVNDIHDLGTKKPGDEIRATFQLENGGLGPLEILGIRTSCGCDRIELTKDSKIITQFPVILNSHEKCILQMSHKIGLDVYGQINKPVTIFTNDPKNPEKTVVAKITDVEKDVYTPTDNITLGIINHQSKLIDCIKHIPVYSKFNKTVGDDYIKVESTRLIDVKFIPNLEINEIDSITNKFTKLFKIGQISLFLKTRDPVVFNESIKCTKHDESEFFKISVSGEIRSTFEITPSITFLPRMGLVGPVFTSNISIKRGDEVPFQIASINKPEFVVLKNNENLNNKKINHIIKIQIDDLLQEKLKTNPNKNIKIIVTATESQKGVELLLTAIEVTNAQN